MLWTGPETCNKCRGRLATSSAGSSAQQLAGAVGITHGKFSRLSSRWSCFSIPARSWFRVNSLRGSGRTGGECSRSCQWFAPYHHAGEAPTRAPLNPPLGLQVLCVDRSAVKRRPSGERTREKARSSGCSRTLGLHELANYAAKSIEKHRDGRSTPAPPPPHTIFVPRRGEVRLRSGSPVPQGGRPSSSLLSRACSPALSKSREREPSSPLSVQWHCTPRARFPSTAKPTATGS